MDLYGWIVAQLVVMLYAVDGSPPWDSWWEYKGINGPGYWGKWNPEWFLCEVGRQQSPINIEPKHLLFDPNLKHIKVDSTLVEGILIKTGQDITLRLKSDGHNHVNLSLGPLSYRYRVAEIKFHLANNGSAGSEHTVGGKAFPVEMHIIAYNSELYKNISEASAGNNGLAIVAVFMEIGNKTDKDFYHISKELKHLRKKAGLKKIKGYPSRPVKRLSLTHLMPRTSEYVTYQGSLTQPGCYETVTWILLNKPLRISQDQLNSLRVLYNHSDQPLDPSRPPMPLEVNARPLMPLNGRVVRTNIDTNNTSRLCSMKKEMAYEVNPRYLIRSDKPAITSDNF